jgi:hypothetical protein
VQDDLIYNLSSEQQTQQIGAFTFSDYTNCANVELTYTLSAASTDSLSTVDVSQLVKFDVSTR